MSAQVEPLTSADPRCPDCGAAEIEAYSDGSLACMRCGAPIYYEYVVPEEYRGEIEAYVHECRRLGNEALKNGDRLVASIQHGVANHVARGLSEPEEQVEQATMFDTPVVLRGETAQRLVPPHTMDAANGC